MDYKEPKVYAVKHKNEEVRVVSRSGGIFTALSDAVLEENGVVYGCVLTEEFQAVHVRAEDKKIRNHMRGSKYIQSKLGDTYINVKADLESGRKVLFSGTSCQIAGLRSFLGKKFENLLCVDIVCHGVPSPAVWKRYLEWQEKKYSQKIVSVDFRNKKDFGWHAHVETLRMDDGRKCSDTVFTTLFYGHNILRPCCYKCPYKSIKHPGDITIADYWGIEKAAPEFDDNKGVSLVLINDDKGDMMFKNIVNELDWKSTKIKDSMQVPLKEPFPRPTERDIFWKDYRDREFSYIAKKYGGYGLGNKFRMKLKCILSKFKKE